MQALDVAALAELDERRRYTPSYQPHPRQEVFHASKARFRLYGGAAGGGKSRALREELVDLSNRFHGLNCYLFRRTYRELEESQILGFRREVPQAWYRYNEQRHEAVFRRTGSRILFRYCDSDNDVYSYQSAEFDVLAVDELGHFKPDWIRYLWSRMRPTADGHRTLFVAATNPGGASHHFNKSVWVDRDPSVAAEYDLDLAEFAFIPARLSDNPTIMDRDPTYGDRLASLPEPERAALLEGSWESFVGQFFRSWRRELHVVDPFGLPESWPKVRAIDYGASAPLCCLWLALNPAHGRTADTARIYVYREHYEAGQSLKHHVDRVLALSPEREAYRETVADPSMWSKTQELGAQRVSLEEQARGYGLRLTRAINDRAPGWETVGQLLEPRADGQPGLLVMRGCSNLIRTLPQMQHDKKQVEDLDSDLEDHAVDALRYGVMALLAGAGKGSAPQVGGRTADLASRRGRGF